MYSVLASFFLDIEKHVTQVFRVYNDSYMYRAIYRVGNVRTTNACTENSNCIKNTLVLFYVPQLTRLECS